MKNLLILSVVTCMISACVSNSNKTTEASNIKDTKAESNLSVPTDKEYLEAIVFHKNIKCSTCDAIKKNTEEIVDSLAVVYKKNNTVVYRLIDYSKEENKILAEKYEIPHTSLLLVNHNKEGKESVTNMTEFAIRNARTDTPKFRDQLTHKIDSIFN